MRDAQNVPHKPSKTFLSSELSALCLVESAESAQRSGVRRIAHTPGSHTLVSEHDPPPPKNRTCVVTGAPGWALQNLKAAWRG